MNLEAELSQDFLEIDYTPLALSKTRAMSPVIMA
jgi:hypothetical protein